MCGADEKIIRLFEPPAIFANILNNFSLSNLRLFFPNEAEEKQVLE